MSILLERAENKSSFSSFPQAMDEYFTNNNVELQIIPEEFSPTLEKKRKNIKITSAKQLAFIINAEIDFWKNVDPKDKLSSFSKINSLCSAKQNFDSATTQYNSNQPSSGKSYLYQCISCLSQGFLYSKTSFAKYIVENLLELPTEIINGFRIGILKDKSANLPSTTGAHEGLLLSMQYRKIIDSLVSPAKEEITSLCESVDEAAEKYSELNSRYVQSFHEHDTMITEFVKKTNEHFEELHANSDEYFKERDKRCTELEKLYTEKLRLKAPAEYWNKLAKKYNVSGIHWMSASVFSALAIVATLILTLINLPSLFSEDSNWLVLFRNSAILTVMTSILVYLVRYFIKMAMSSFHLSRDARERENLSHFYLALIEEGAVSEKERAIILNSLFSRSDSGLLKGDASPTMSNNPSELIDILKNK